MKYGELKTLVSGLLIGDNRLPKEDDETKALLMLAFNDIASRAESLHLITLNQNKEILRKSIGKHLTRYPDMPEDDNSILDIDKDLCFVAARFISSYISKNKPVIHFQEGEKMIRTYNGKVNSILESLDIDENGEAYVKD